MSVRKLVVGLLGPSLFALGCASVAVADDSAVDVLTQETPPATDPPATGGGVDLTGTWFAKVKTKADIRVPIVGVAPSDVDLALKLFVKREGGKLSADVAICNLATTSASLVLGFDRVEPFIKLTESIPDFEATVGGKVPLPDVVFNIGQDAAGTAVDLDGDTFPGGTVGVIALGLLPLDAYVGLKLKITMDATLADPETVTGNATFSGDGNVFGSNFPLLTSGFVTVTQTLMPTPFSAKHYAGDVACAELLAKP
jgi:hypothetical protein